MHTRQPTICTIPSVNHAIRWYQHNSILWHRHPNISSSSTISRPTHYYCVWRFLQLASAHSVRITRFESQLRCMLRRILEGYLHSENGNFSSFVGEDPQLWFATEKTTNIFMHFHDCNNHQHSKHQMLHAPSNTCRCNCYPQLVTTASHLFSQTRCAGNWQLYYMISAMCQANVRLRLRWEPAANIETCITVTSWYIWFKSTCHCFHMHQAG